MRQRNERSRQRGTRLRVVVWWGELHRTPAGQECHWCTQQGELFPRDQATTHRYITTAGRSAPGRPAYRSADQPGPAPPHRPPGRPGPDTPDRPAPQPAPTTQT
ncbi:MAG: hypothetical protein LC700_00045 [Actinobacteria bacterium]|nr:hypothetical protein [Actinomycetota bacterium]